MTILDLFCFSILLCQPAVSVARPCSQVHHLDHGIAPLVQDMNRLTDKTLGRTSDPALLSQTAKLILQSIQEAISSGAPNTEGLRLDLARFADDVGVRTRTVGISAPSLKFSQEGFANPASTESVIRYLANLHLPVIGPRLTPKYDVRKAEIHVIRFRDLDFLPHEERRAFRLEELGTLIEEYGHLVQYLRARTDGSFFISSFLQTSHNRGQILDFIHRNKHALLAPRRQFEDYSNRDLQTFLIEADIYAFSLETLGPDNVPSHVRDNYRIRSFVDYHMKSSTQGRINQLEFEDRIEYPRIWLEPPLLYVDQRE